MRNWWAKAYVDGRKTPVTFGPRRKDGGFTLYINQRSEGRSFRAAAIYATPTDEALILDVRVFDENGTCVAVNQLVTRR